MAPPSPTIDRLRQERTTGPRLAAVRVLAPKPTARQRVPHKAAISPAAFKDLSHKTPEAALFARLKKRATKKGSSGLTHDVVSSLGSVTVAQMATAVRKADLAAELKQKVCEKEKAKLDAMGGGTGRANPFARPFR